MKPYQECVAISSVLGVIALWVVAFDSFWDYDNRISPMPIVFMALGAIFCAVMLSIKQKP